MAYKYNSWKHSLQITVNDAYPETPWEVAIYGANSGRKLKVIDRVKTQNHARIVASAVTDYAR